MEMRVQRRGRALAMTLAELDEFLTAERTCRIATLSPDGPHVAALWFLWDGATLWLNSLVRSQRWADVRRDPRVAVAVDAGEEFGELRGVEIKGTAGPVGEIPGAGPATPSSPGSSGCSRASTSGARRCRTMGATAGCV